jgi:hypothetical protein
LLCACHSTAPIGSQASATPTAATTLNPGLNLIVGRVLAVDVLRHFAIIDIAASTPSSALSIDRELLTYTDDLRITTHLRATRQFRGRTLGAIIAAGAPHVGDEMIFTTQP